MMRFRTTMHVASGVLQTLKSVQQDKKMRMQGIFILFASAAKKVFLRVRRKTVSL